MYKVLKNPTPTTTTTASHTLTKMGSIHHTRILRFLIVLVGIVLTIFVYASYYSNGALTPPSALHMRAVSQAPAAAAYSASQQHWPPPPSTHQQIGGAVPSNHSSSSDLTAAESSALKSVAAASNAAGAASSSSAASSSVHHKPPKKNAIIFALKKPPAPPPPPHHRVPTIDENADGGAAAGNSLDLADDAAALDERDVNNDLLEEQYVQSIDNTMGNINNSVIIAGQAQSPLPQQQQQQQLAQQTQQQQQQQIQLTAAAASASVDNNLNKILDSDVLIPTSNLQKFIENADKILKNITAVPAAVPPPPAPPSASKSFEKDLPTQKVAERPSAPAADSPSGAAAAEQNEDIDADSAPQPPSAVMTIKRQNNAAPAEIVPPPAAAAAAAITTKTNSGSGKPKVTPKLQAPAPPGPPGDTSAGILTQQIYEAGHANEELDIERLCPHGGADLKLLILITSAQSHAEARLAIRQTWAHYGTRRDVSTAFILGRSTNETLNLALTQENFIYGDLVRGHFIDSYNNLTLKTISALQWVDEHCSHAKYVLKTDDDMFINVPKLLAFLDSHAKEKRVIYGRLAKKWKPIRNKKSKYYVSTGQFSAPVFPPFTTGPAYVMSSDIVHDLYVRALQQVYLKLEDVFTTGIVAQQLAIKRVHVNEFLNRRIAFNPCNIRKTISVHMIKANEQFDLWKKLLDQTTKCK